MREHLRRFKDYEAQVCTAVLTVAIVSGASRRYPYQLEHGSTDYTYYGLPARARLY